MLNEFKAFILRGNVLDLAVGVIVGAAFNKIVSSLVDDILMPPLGLLLGRVDFSSLFVSLDGKTYASLPQAMAVSAPVLKYGAFLNTIIQFLIVSFVVFLLIRQVNKLLPAQPKADAPELKACPYCCSNIPQAASRCPQCTSALVEAAA